MSMQMMPFGFENHEVRVYLDDERNPWWVAADVCRIIGIANVGNAIARLRTDEKRPLNGIRETGNGLIINESGLYRLIFRSNKPEAERFQDWVFSEVLPQIRKTGKYEPTLPTVSDPNLQLLLEQSKLMQQIIIDLDRAQIEAAAAKASAEQAKEMAIQIAYAQQYMSIREFVKFHDLTHQMPPGRVQQDFGRFLVGYCKETGWPLRKQKTEQFDEWQYPTHIIQQMIYGFLSRRYGQIEIGDDGIWSRES